LIICVLAIFLASGWQVVQAADGVGDANSVDIPPPQQFWFSGCFGSLPCLTPDNFTRSFNDAFFIASGAIALSIFVVGAFLMVISAGNDTLLQAAKRAMKGSLIGLALVVGSYGIYRTIVFLLYS